MSSFLERALLVKFYYRNDENATATVREFRRLKKHRSGPIFEQVLRDMMVKLQRTGQLEILPGEGGK